MKIDGQLLVWLKGVDLSANTARLTLVGNMGFANALVGLRRFDYFRFEVDPGTGDPEEGVESLKGVLDRQSTFYNRNKHAYSLSCTWKGGKRLEGVSREELQKRWVAELHNSMKNSAVRDFCGKKPGKPVIFNEVTLFLVEVMVEDDDASARDSIAAKLQGGLAGMRVSCVNEATVWWIALSTRSREEAAALAEKIAVTTRRDAGLLMNPNFQNVEFVAVTEVQDK
jgi:hypothetical protein